MKIGQFSDIPGPNLIWSKIRFGLSDFFFLENDIFWKMLLNPRPALPLDFPPPAGGGGGGV